MRYPTRLPYKNPVSQEGLWMLTCNSKGYLTYVEEKSKEVSEN